jgi:hypothetical protein
MTWKPLLGSTSRLGPIDPGIDSGGIDADPTDAKDASQQQVCFERQHQLCVV